MNQDQIAAMQQRIKTAIIHFLKLMGFGGKSQTACRDYLTSLMPKPNPWPLPDQKSLKIFYGEPGNESNLVMIDFPYPMYYGGKHVTRTRVHKNALTH